MSDEESVEVIKDAIDRVQQAVESVEETNKKIYQEINRTLFFFV